MFSMNWPVNVLINKNILIFILFSIKGVSYYIYKFLVAIEVHPLEFTKSTYIWLTKSPSETTY